MITEILVSVEFYGESFSPAKAKKATGIVFNTKNEAGDIGHIGRYKGKPRPYGSASLETPENIENINKIMWLANTLKGKIEPMHEFGLVMATLNVGYFWKNQCNCKLSKEELKAISLLGIDFCFSCYEDD